MASRGDVCVSKLHLSRLLLSLTGRCTSFGATKRFRKLVVTLGVICCRYCNTSTGGRGRGRARAIWRTTSNTKLRYGLNT